MPCKNHPEEVVGLVKCSRCGEEFCRNCVVELKGSFYCAGCKTEQVRDVQSGVDGTELDLASIGARFGALFVDNFLINLLSQVITPVVLPALARALGTGDPGTPGIAAFALTMVLFIAVKVLYEGVMLQWRGQTLGKMATKVKVVTPEGDDISAGQAWLRALMKEVLSLAVGITYLVALFNKEKKALHDMIAKTRVVVWRP